MSNVNFKPAWTRLPRYAAAISGLIALTGAAAHAAGPTVANGSFETIQGGQTSSYAVGGNGTSTSTNTTAVPSWTMTIPSTSWSCVVVGGNLGNCGYSAKSTAGLSPAPNGANYFAAESDSGYSPTISETIANLIGGATYAITFWQAAVEDASIAANGVQWVVGFGGGSQNSTAMNVPVNGDVGWASQTLLFTVGAATTSSTLSFLAQGGPGSAPPLALLDNISIAQVTVPEPPPLAVLGLCLAGLAWIRRRRMSFRA